MHRYLAAIRSHVPEMENLELREMMSASPIAWHLEMPNVSKAVTIANATKTQVTPTAITTEPAIGDASLHYASFARDPLYAAAGPKPDDVRQGELGDCYLMASLSAIAKANQTMIENDIAQLPDDTYSVAFASGKKTVVEHVDTKFPVDAEGRLAYAQLGPSNSVWVAVMEKAFAEFRSSANSYAAVNGGWMAEVFSDFGLSNKSTTPPKSSAALLSQLQADLKANDATTIGTNTAINAGVPLLADHAYVVDRVNLGSNGKPVSVRLRNPWGIDGAGNDGNDDGYVTVTAAQAEASLVGVCVAMK